WKERSIMRHCGCLRHSTSSEVRYLTARGPPPHAGDERPLLGDAITSDSTALRNHLAGHYPWSTPPPANKPPYGTFPASYGFAAGIRPPPSFDWPETWP